MQLTKDRTGIELRLYELALKIVEELGYELYDLDYIKGSSTLRIFIMDPKTKSAVIEDCIKVDRAFTPYCETEEWIPSDFVLEVSSPGVYRALKTKKHFDDVIGETILVSLSRELNEQQKSSLPAKAHKTKKMRGKLTFVDDVKINIDYEGASLGISFDQIKKASLDPDLDG